MALEVINDSRSELHRDWVSATVVQILGVRIDYGIWVLRLRDLEREGLSIALSGPGATVLTAQIREPGRTRSRSGELVRALKRAGIHGPRPGSTPVR
jgi:hypothetical protein